MDLKILQLRLLVPPHFLIYEDTTKMNLDLMVFIIQLIYQKIKDGAFVENLDEYFNIGTHWIALYVLNNGVTYFDSFGVEYIPKEFKTFIGNKSIKTNIFRTQAYDSVMYGYFCIGFINFVLAGKALTDFTNLFSPNNFKKMMIYF